MVFRIYYSNGFWADESASNRKDAEIKADKIAYKNGVNVVKIESRP